LNDACSEIASSPKVEEGEGSLGGNEEKLFPNNERGSEEIAIAMVERDRREEEEKNEEERKKRKKGERGEACQIGWGRRLERRHSRL